MPFEPIYLIKIQMLHPCNAHDTKLYTTNLPFRPEYIQPSNAI